MHRILDIHRFPSARQHALLVLGVLALTLSLGACATDDRVTWPSGDAIAGLSTADVIVDDDRVQCPTAHYRDLHAAVDNALPGQTIFVCGGSYVGTVTIPANKTGLTLLGAGGDPTQRHGDPAKEAVVLGSAKGRPGFEIWANGSTVAGFTVLRTSSTGIEVKATDREVPIQGVTIARNVLEMTGDPEATGTNCAGGRGLNVEVAKNIVIEHNQVRQSCGAGIRLKTVTHSVVRRNVIDGSRKRPGIAVRGGSTHNLISDNLSRNNREAGISLKKSTQNVVRANRMTHNGVRGVSLRAIPNPGSNTDADDTTHLASDKSPQNTWEDNACTTSNRQGLCQL